MVLSRALVNFGWPERQQIGGAAWAKQFSSFAYLFQKFFSKELLLSRYALVTV